MQRPPTHCVFVDFSFYSIYKFIRTIFSQWRQEIINAALKQRRVQVKRVLIRIEKCASEEQGEEAKKKQTEINEWQMKKPFRNENECNLSLLAPWKPSFRIRFG